MRFTYIESVLERVKIILQEPTWRRDVKVRTEAPDVCEYRVSFRRYTEQAQGGTMFGVCGLHNLGLLEY